MGSTSDHFAKNQPIRIERDVPFRRAARLVPQLDPLKMFAKSGDENVEKVGVLLRVARRRTLARSDAEAHRRVMKTWQHIYFPRETRKQPGVPVFAILAMPVSPRYAGAQLFYSDGAQIANQLLDALYLTRP